MSAAHTPGPWVIGGHSIHGGGGTICHGALGIPAGDLALIAAAPELLAALLTARDYVADELSAREEQLKHAIATEKLVRDDLRCIDAAIAKAEGRS